MNDKLTEIKQLFAKQIEWYQKTKLEEANGEVDSSYIYDTAIEQFDTMTRGEAQTLLEILSTPQQELLDKTEEGE